MPLSEVRSVNRMTEQMISYDAEDKHPLATDSCLDSDHFYCEKNWMNMCSASGSYMTGQQFGRQKFRSVRFLKFNCFTFDAHLGFLDRFLVIITLYQ